MELFTKCPYCEKIMKSGRGLSSHLKSKHNKTYSESLKDIYEKNVPEILNSFPKESETMSLTDFKEKYGLQFEQTLKLYEIFKIKPRTLKESASLKERNEKIKATCLKKYGDTNVLGKKSKIYLKRNKTVKEKYGVDNVFQLEEVKKKINSEDVWLKKYGLTRGELISKKLKERWDSLSDDDRKTWLEKSIRNKNSSCVSNLEKNVAKRLLDYGWSIETQLCLPNLEKATSRKIFLYDIYIKELNLLVEVNGDYWHANPSIYNEEDTIPFFGEEKKVSDIWLFDKEKIDNAKNMGYNIITIWEKDVLKNKHAKADGEIVDNINDLILEEMYENNKNNKNNK